MPHRTYPRVNAPWAPAGRYTIRLTVNGARYTQPLVVRFDPRVKTNAAALSKLSALSREMYDGARSSRASYERGRALAASLDSVSGPDVAAFKAQVERLL